MTVDPVRKILPEVDTDLLIAIEFNKKFEFIL